MGLTLSRVLLGIEAGIILLPVTLYSLFFGIAMIGSVLNGSDHLYLIPTAFFALLSLLAGWVLIYRFFVKGSGWLEDTGNHWFFLASLGVFIVVLSGISILFFPRSPLSVFIFGCPAAIVFLHLALERQFRRWER